MTAAVDWRAPVPYPSLRSVTLRLYSLARVSGVTETSHRPRNPSYQSPLVTTGWTLVNFEIDSLPSDGTAHKVNKLGDHRLQVSENASQVGWWVLKSRRLFVQHPVDCRRVQEV